MSYSYRAFVLSCFRDNTFLFRVLHNLTCNRTGPDFLNILAIKLTEFAFCTTNYLLNGRILEFVIQANELPPWQATGN